jgi:hypothetical protein
MDNDGKKIESVRNSEKEYLSVLVDFLDALAAQNLEEAVLKGLRGFYLFPFCNPNENYHSYLKIDGV